MNQPGRGSAPEPMRPKAGSPQQEQPGPGGAPDASSEESPPDSAPPSIPSAAVVKQALTPVPGSVGSAAGRIAPAPRVQYPVRLGDLLAGRYEVQQILGEGGMGIVYGCRDRALGDRVAVKRVTLPEDHLATDYVLWFYKEARALAALDHPGVVRARDFGRLRDGTPFLVMDLAPGVSLHDLSWARLSYPLIWSIVDQILSALAHAHARGVVHGDLKPSNVLVEERPGAPPLARILDFGLAWLKRDPHDQRLDGTVAPEFTPHAGAGTPGFMAPEQIQHEMHHVSGATDLYALGCILYRALGGKAPFAGESRELLRLHAFERPPPVVPLVEVPTGVVEFVARLLAKRPWDRWEFSGEARRAWHAFRPHEVPDAAWRFPPLVAVAGPAPPTAPVPSREPNPASEVRSTAPELELSRDEQSGLLGIRPSPLVGREEIRRQLQVICDEVAAGQGAPHRLVLLVGPAGVGKSRLAEWLCETVHEQGTMVPLRARYRRMRSAIDGMVGAVQEWLNFERADRNTIERSLIARWEARPEDKAARAWVAGAAEWLRPTPPGTEQPVGPSEVRFALDTVETRRRVIRYTLRRLARGRPLLFWLDDLHHGPPGTFEGLRRIHDEERDQRIVMVATVRAEDVQLGTPAAERLRELREAMDGVVVPVEPLDPDTTAELLRASLNLDDSAVLEASRRSRGNPLFALQQLHAWALAGELKLEGGLYRVPESVLELRPATTAELWDQRLAALPGAHRPAALAAAALGGDLRRPVLEALLRSLGLDAGDCIVSLQHAEVLLPRGSDRYGWPHALLQEHLLARLLEQPDSARTFEAAAEALTRHPQSRGRRVVRQRVVNLLNANQAERAAEVLFQHLEQVWHSERDPGTALTDLELLKGRLEGRSLAEKHRWQAEALRHLGRTEEAITHAEIARSSYEELGDQVNLAHSMRLLGHLASERGQSVEGLLLVQLALQLFRDLGHRLGQAQCEAVAGEIEYLLGNYEAARELVISGEANFHALDHALGRGQCLLLLSWVEHGEGLVARSRQHTLEARAEFERAGYRLGMAQASVSLSHVEHRLLNFFSAEIGALEALAAFEALGTPRGQAACERLLAMVGLDTDDLDLAEMHATRALSIYRAIGDPWGTVEAGLLECQAALCRRDLERARALMTEVRKVKVEEAEPRQHLLLTRAWLEALSGDFDRAFELLEDASEVFGQRTRAGDHTPHLLDRLSRLPWPEHARHRIDSWRAVLNDRARRSA